ncbi:DNA repair protein RecO [Atopococcus tabaci]|uniref:DNA repair protein RecO n=1 Tax=Atopococcus tabaci TaxID=269774 RepID=UPI002409F0D8|nr:DNA repair protein RecO [Atopococcus tabaci]
MAHLEEVEGLVLFSRQHRERDRLVKIFTDRYGKLMFFVRGTKRPNGKLTTAIQPFTSGTYIADVRPEGLNFLRDAKDLSTPTSMYTDIFKNAYTTYLLGLADAAMEDRVPNNRLLQELILGIKEMDEGTDPEIILNIFEVQLLTQFGVAPELRGCRVCGRTDGVFDYSSKYAGLLCPEHFHLDPRRFHASPKAIHFLRLFSVVSMERIGKIAVKEDTKRELRKVIDQLYDELVGIRLKSKKFIDNMYKWENVLKKPEQPSE